MVILLWRFCMKCKYCGAEIGENDAFCPACGHSTSEFDFEQAASAAPYNGKPNNGQTSPYPPNYSAQGYYPPLMREERNAADQKPTNGPSVAGFVCSLISMIIPVFPILCIIGIILSSVGLSRSKLLNGTGRGLSIAGLVLGIVYLCAFLFLFVILFLWL